MRAVITGGAGFIGSHLADRLLREGWEVCVLDDLSTGWRSKVNIEHIEGKPKFCFQEHDVTRFIVVAGRVDAVFHFASVPSPVQYVQEPIKTLKTGAIGTLNALGLARANGARFFLASTSEVYGYPDEKNHPQSESYWGNVNPIGVRGAYDESKRFAEALTMAYHRYHKIDTRIARIFNTYGPRMPEDGRVVPTMILHALRREPVPIHSEDGEQTRSFCYCEDLVDGLCRLLESSEHEPVNLGTEEEVRIRELGELINRITGNSAGLVFHPEKRVEGDPRVRRPDLFRARATLVGWEPKFSLEEGLRKTIEWFAARRK